MRSVKGLNKIGGDVTRLETLRKCRSMWRWLAKHPASAKHEYLEHAKVPKSKWPRHGCYACEQARIHDSTSVRCKYCVLKDYAWTRGCTAMGSDYTLWHYAHRAAVRTAHAQRIADACTCAIMDLTRSKRPRPEYVPVPE